MPFCLLCFPISNLSIEWGGILREKRYPPWGEGGENPPKAPVAFWPKVKSEIDTKVNEYMEKGWGRGQSHQTEQQLAKKQSTPKKLLGMTKMKRKTTSMNSLNQKEKNIPFYCFPSIPGIPPSMEWMNEWISHIWFDGFPLGGLYSKFTQNWMPLKDRQERWHRGAKMANANSKKGIRGLNLKGAKEEYGKWKLDDNNRSKWKMSRSWGREGGWH